MAEQLVESNQSFQFSRLRCWFGRSVGITLSILFAFLLLEISLRVGFDNLPDWPKGAIQNVRVVPWRNDTLIFTTTPCSES